MSKLWTQKLIKIYGQRRVVNELSVEVQQGEVVGLLGPNGAGKTTTFNMILGLVKPNGGRVFLDSTEITNLPMFKRARLGISYLQQETSIFRKLTVEENLRAILENLPISKQVQEERLEQLMEELGIGHLARNYAYTLSGGERRRVEIARALCLAPSFLLLDEPFTGVDPRTVEELQHDITGLKEKGLGVLVTDHNVRETLEITDHSYLIYEGEVLIAGQAAELINDPEARRLYLGEKFYMRLGDHHDQ